MYKLFNTNDSYAKDLHTNNNNRKMVQGDYSYNVHNKRYNLSVERPNTHLTSTAENYSNKWLALNDLARKEGQSFKAG